MSIRVDWLPLLTLFAVCGCAEALDWREMKPADLHIVMSMPCRPTSHARKVPLDGQVVAMTLHACNARDLTFSLGTFDVVDPALVGGALAALRAAAVGNVQGHVVNERAADVPGMTPHPAARQLSIAGRLPNGPVVHERVLLFSRGTQVYQATLLGSDVDDALTSTFFDGLKVIH